MFCQGAEFVEDVSQLFGVALEDGDTSFQAERRESDAGGFKVEAYLSGAQPQVAAVDAESLPASVEFFSVALQRPADDDEVQFFALVPQQLFSDGPRQAPHGRAAV